MVTDWFEREEGGHRLPVVVLRPDAPRWAVSSATLGGGLGLRHWILNATVHRGYSRDDPEVHLAELALEVGLDGPGVGLMTAVDVRRMVTTVDGGVTVRATVGVEEPSWAAAPSPDWHAEGAVAVGTINVVVDLPVRMSDAALVNAVATATEAKSQAMAEAGWAGTGTPTDAVCILCPTEGAAQPYGGPRSVWGARIARAVHVAVTEGLATQDADLP
ncbi:adenosylcobinamide amidohydrolase [Actinomarinicola tropica]|uniref:Adenosylcobinamide amidohydrolase n=1 Tax=Actinomarinicola tropica TaxID=2789776 RepID=A0A5Q2RLG0_9ACTN|nr:adenosylcobinamide amidohydrolase [Actinomarinicola tropica]QGG95266.1 adenosylcobinamide amidohydrolase [Actinomarinicola tropica]